MAKVVVLIVAAVVVCCLLLLPTGADAIGYRDKPGIYKSSCEFRSKLPANPFVSEIYSTNELTFRDSDVDPCHITVELWKDASCEQMLFRVEVAVKSMKEVLAGAESADIHDVDMMIDYTTLTADSSLYATVLNSVCPQAEPFKAGVPQKILQKCEPAASGLMGMKMKLPEGSMVPSPQECPVWYFKTHFKDAGKELAFSSFWGELPKPGDPPAEGVRCTAALRAQEFQPYAMAYTGPDPDAPPVVVVEGAGDTASSSTATTTTTSTTSTSTTTDTSTTPTPATDAPTPKAQPRNIDLLHAEPESSGVGAGVIIVIVIAVIAVLSLAPYAYRYATAQGWLGASRQQGQQGLPSTAAKSSSGSGQKPAAGAKKAKPGAGGQNKVKTSKKPAAYTSDFSDTVDNAANARRGSYTVAGRTEGSGSESSDDEMDDDENAAKGGGGRMQRSPTLNIKRGEKLQVAETV
jgi:hypothetical protein